jgi:hypothetical protein
VGLNLYFLSPLHVCECMCCIYTNAGSDCAVVYYSNICFRISVWNLNEEQFGDGYQSV